MRAKTFKIFSLSLSFILLFSVFHLNALTTPFEKDTEGSERYRIPAAVTTREGVLLAADARYNHGTDSPENIDTLLAFSKDGKGDYIYSFVNKFNDCKDGTSSKSSASFIDPQLTVSKDGTIYLICDLYPFGGGYPTGKKGSGYIEINGKKRLALTANDPTKIKDFEYYVDDFSGDFAKVLKRSGEATPYSINKQFDLFKNRKALTCTMINSSETINQNIFYEAADLKVFRTSYLSMKKSTDGGKTFSDPVILNEFIKSDKQSFLGICPGKGLSITVNGKERLLFPVYDNERKMEHTRIVYSDDGGKTFNITKQVKFRIGLQKCSEAQLIDCGNGKLMMYARNGSHYIGFSQSTDGGITWSKMKADMSLHGQANCMVSLIKTSKTVDGKPVVLCSYPSKPGKRANGVVRSGLLTENGIDWKHTYYTTDGFYAYSSLNELADGTIGYLFEDEAAHIAYDILNVKEDGSLKSEKGKEATPTDNNRGFVYNFEKLLNKIGIL